MERPGWPQLGSPSALPRVEDDLPPAEPEGENLVSHQCSWAINPWLSPPASHRASRCRWRAGDVAHVPCIRPRRATPACRIRGSSARAEMVFRRTTIADSQSIIGQRFRFRSRPSGGRWFSSLGPCGSSGGGDTLSPGLKPNGRRPEGHCGLLSRQPPKPWPRIRPPGERVSYKSSAGRRSYPAVSLITRRK